MKWTDRVNGTTDSAAYTRRRFRGRAVSINWTTGP